MLYNNHNIYLYVNEKSVDLESEDSLGIRFNEVMFNPEKIGSTSASYSFEFELPATRNNNKIFDYANVLSKNNKFHNRYEAELICDGARIFNGTLVINSYKDKKYTCNLVDVKTYSLEEIFGDLKMTDIPWYVTFDGVESINQYNADSDEVKFPLVSYGVFAKDPYNTDDVYNDYTSKFKFDKWNKWYVQSFYPSHNMMETIRKAFQYKSYEVMGDAFTDETLKNIYMSINLDSEQSPDYNVGHTYFGLVDINTNATFGNSNDGYMQELQFPYEHVQLRSQPAEGEDLEKYNFDNILIYNLLTSGVTSNQSPCYMYQPNENCIVIPATGFYKIKLTANTTVDSALLNAALYCPNDGGYAWTYNNYSIQKSLSAMTPVEIAIVRNYDDNYELIKGKNNIEYTYGIPASGSTKWVTCFPHEDPVAAKLPTKKNDLNVVNQTNMRGSRSETGNNMGGTRSTIDRDAGGRIYSNQKYGYMYHNNNPMCYDQAVSPSFICGLSSWQGGVSAVMKNGYSWSKSNSTKNQVFSEIPGYDYTFRPSGTSATLSAESTNYNANTYAHSTSGVCTANTTAMTGEISACVYLEKGDIINVFLITRAMFNKDGVIVPYPVNVKTKVRLQAFSPRNWEDLAADSGFTTNGDYSPTEFPVQLNLSNFFNSGTTIQSFIQNVASAFNLEIIQNGKQIFVNKRKKIADEGTGVVNIDDRISNDEAETSRINYPKSMCVSYKTDTSEWGFEQTVPVSKIDLPDWDKYGDSGFTKIMLNDDYYVTDESNVSTQFSYCWYDDFEWTKVDTGHQENSAVTTTFSLPVISQATYMVDRYDYDESEQHDGYSLTQRFWFKPTMQPYIDSQYHSTPSYVWTDTYPQQQVYIYTPSNSFNGMNLSYKNSERSLLDYFNIQANLESNYVTVDVYLTADEYTLLKNGGKVRFDSDIYDVVEITGYDPLGIDKTTLKLMKRS